MKLRRQVKFDFPDGGELHQNQDGQTLSNNNSDLDDGSISILQPAMHSIHRGILQCFARKQFLFSTECPKVPAVRPIVTE